MALNFDPAIKRTPDTATINSALECLDRCGLRPEQMSAIRAILADNAAQEPAQMKGSVSVLETGSRGMKRTADDHPEAPAAKRVNNAPQFDFAQYNPLMNFDTFARAAHFLGKAEVGRLARTCKLLFNFCLEASIWKQVTINEGIPLVGSKKVRDYRADLKLLAPLTISGKMIEECLGPVVGNIPCLSKRWFHNLSKPYCSLYGNLFYKSRSSLVVVPGHVKRTYSKDFPYGLDNQGNLIERSIDEGMVDGQELTILLNKKNLEVLVLHPLKANTNLQNVYNCLESNPNLGRLDRDCFSDWNIITSRNRLFVALSNVFPFSEEIEWVHVSTDSLWWECFCGVALSRPNRDRMILDIDEPSSEEVEIPWEESALSSDDDSSDLNIEMLSRLKKG